MNDYIMVDCTDDLGDELLKVLGQINVRFGQLERVVALTIKRTTDGMTLDDAEKLRDMFFKLTQAAEDSFEDWVKDKDRAEDFRKFMEEARRLAKRRNDIVHAFWGKVGDEVYWNRLGKHKPVDVAALKVLRQEIALLTAVVSGQTRPDLTVFEVRDELT